MQCNTSVLEHVRRRHSAMKTSVAVCELVQNNRARQEEAQ